jgi:hypothetical protein
MEKGVIARVLSREQQLRLAGLQDGRVGDRLQRIAERIDGAALLRGLSGKATELEHEQRG